MVLRARSIIAANGAGCPDPRIHQTFARSCWSTRWRPAQTSPGKLPQPRDARRSRWTG